MKRRIAFFPIAVAVLMHVITYGIRPQVLFSWVAIAWVTIGLKLTDRECKDDFYKAIFFSWFWPLWLLRRGLFGYDKYQIELNDIEIGLVTKADLYDLAINAIKSPTLYLAQIRQFASTAIFALLIALVIGSAIVLWVAVFIGKYDGHLLVECVRTWLETGNLPYALEGMIVGKALMIWAVFGLTKNVFTEHIRHAIRVRLKQPALGSLLVKPVP